MRKFILIALIVVVAWPMFVTSADASEGCQYFGDNPKYPVLYNSEGDFLPECMTPDNPASGDSPATFGMPNHIDCDNPPTKPYPATCGEPGDKPKPKLEKSEPVNETPSSQYALPNTGK